MSLIYLPVDKQAEGEINGGEIIEKKPIGFPQDGGLIKPYSNIFYWSFARVTKDTTIPEHPHKGFEILTIVLQGEIEHYENKNKVWKKLTAGDAQLIKAGNGITHIESLSKNSEIFQIWFDPDLSKSINKESFYKDFSSDKLPIKMEENKSTKMYIGVDAPIKMSSEGVEIKELSLSIEEHILKLDTTKVYSGFVIEGEIVIQDKLMNKGDFFIIKRQGKEKINVLKDSRLFIVDSPLQTSYKTYAEIHHLENNL